MNLTSTVRRSDQPLQIGGRHGYRIEGDWATLNAELSVPPYHPGGAWALELWACERAHQGGELAGVKVGEVQFELPTPLAPHTHRVEAQVPARLPLQGRSHAMLLALVEQGNRRVHDVANYPERETFPAPHFEGDVGYEIHGCEVLLKAAAVVNSRAGGNLSGTLSLELWALPVDGAASSESARGQCLGAAQVAPVAGGEAAFALHCRAAFSEPPPGRFQLVLRLREWTHALGYVTRDQRSFSLLYQVPVSEPLAEPEVASPAVSPAPAAPVEAPAVEAVAAPAAVEVAAPAAVEVAAPAAVAAVSEVSLPAEPASVAPTRSPRVSIQTASVEELARVKGLNVKLAKEIIKARPFASLEELVKVRGIGRKSLDKLRSLLRL